VHATPHILPGRRGNRLYSSSGELCEFTHRDRVAAVLYGVTASTAFMMRLSETGYAVPSAWAK
jgi:hypothetical protein